MNESRPSISQLWLLRVLLGPVYQPTLAVLRALREKGGGAAPGHAQALRVPAVRHEQEAARRARHRQRERRLRQAPR